MYPLAIAVFLAVAALLFPGLALGQDAPVATEAVTVEAAAPTPPVVVVADETEAQRPLLVIVQLASPEATPAVAPEPSYVVPASHAIDPDDELEEAPPFVPAPVSLGLSGLVGTRDAGPSGLAPTWTAGIDLGFRLGDHFALGLRRVTVSATTQGPDTWAFGLSPYVEIATRLWDRIEPYAQLGAALELRRTANVGVGVAPFTGIGVRFFAADLFSIAIEGAVHVPVTDSFLLGHEQFPLGAVVVQGGLAFAFHIG